MPFCHDSPALEPTNHRPNLQKLWAKTNLSSFNVQVGVTQCIPAARMLEYIHQGNPASSILEWPLEGRTHVSLRPHNPPCDLTHKHPRRRHPGAESDTSHKTSRMPLPRPQIGSSPCRPQIRPPQIRLQSSSLGTLVTSDDQVPSPDMLISLAWDVTVQSAVKAQVLSQEMELW